MGPKKIEVVVTDLGEYINQQCCERSFKLRLNKQEVARKYPFYPAVRNPLNPVLATTGAKREKELKEDLKKRMRYLNPTEEDGTRITWEQFVDALSGIKAGEDCFATEVEVGREMDAFRVTGRMDFALVLWKGGAPCLRIVECKASRKDRTYHRVQLATYRIMVTKLLENGLVIGGKRFDSVPIESVVARIDEGTNRLQNVLELPSLDLREEIEDVLSLLSPGGPLDYVAGHDLDELGFCLEAKCDSCVHCPICLPDTAHKRRLELVGADPSVVRVLKANGVMTLDDLADLDLSSEAVKGIRGTTGFNDDLDDLVRRAKARRSTLPGRRDGDFSVMTRAHPGLGQLPAHDNGQGQRLVRVYLDVGYDYVEDRVVSMAAHVTDSAGELLTRRSNGDDPVPVEQDDAGTPSLLSGEVVVRFMEEAWTGEPTADDAAEGKMIRSFFGGLVEAIEKVSGADDFRPLHFYVWNPRDMVHLIDACSRAGGPLLRNLTELLGCREECQGELEQMIFTPLGGEIDRKMVLGYTGRSLITATAFRWFGRPAFHWTRRVNGSSVDLSRLFRRDIFDYRTVLHLDENDEWCEKDHPSARRQSFEIRTRFSADITSPYWHAMWGILPDASCFKDPLVRRTVEDYRAAGRPELIAAFLECKCQALRWLEEHLRKDDRIVKPLIPVKMLPHIEDEFADRYDLVRACQDFLRLDHHVRKVDWLTAGLNSPANKVAEGLAVPVRNGRFVRSERSTTLFADLALDAYPVDRNVFFSGCTIDEGSFVRVTPCTGDIDQGQRVGDLVSNGVTGTVERIDPDSGTVEVSIITSAYNNDLARAYILRSLPASDLMPHGLVGDSVSDFVSYRVDSWLEDNGRAPAVAWFDPHGPRVPVRPPLSPGRAKRYAALLRELKLSGHGLDEVQAEACMDGLSSTVQLLLGPPGTGKTNTTAAAILLRLAARDKNSMFIVSANTHTAVDELMSRLRQSIVPFIEAARRNGVDCKQVIPLRLSRELGEAGYHVPPENITEIMERAKQGHLVIGGSINEVLKLAGSARKVLGSPLRVDGLTVDEASMMIFPAFLALSTLVSPDGEIMLAGDHLQLSPITAHQWEDETREQVMRYSPHESAYIAVQKLCSQCGPGMIKRSALTTTYRLTPELTHLISGIYRREGYSLESKKGNSAKNGMPTSFRDLWSNGGVFLVVHGEAGSRKSNEFEAALVRDILAARPGPKGAIPPGSVSIITPHRAQRAVLRTTLKGGLGKQIKMIDTVERLQGGECETIIVSGTQSDASAIAGNAEFILELNRTNVIFSRAKERLIVVCSRNLLDSVPADLEDYRSSWLWKHLRSICDTTAAVVSGYEYDVRIMVPGKYWTE